MLETEISKILEAEKSQDHKILTILSFDIMISY
jgi:hypothetical protein